MAAAQGIIDVTRPSQQKIRVRSRRLPGILQAANYLIDGWDDDEADWSTLDQAGKLALIKKRQGALRVVLVAVVGRLRESE